MSKNVIVFFLTSFQHFTILNSYLLCCQCSTMGTDLSVEHALLDDFVKECIHFLSDFFSTFYNFKLMSLLLPVHYNWHWNLSVEHADSTFSVFVGNTQHLLLLVFSRKTLSCCENTQQRSSPLLSMFAGKYSGRCSPPQCLSCDEREQ